MKPFAAIDEALRRAVKAKEIPGVVAMAATESGTLYEGAFGQRDIVHGPAMTPDTVFRIASMTKAVTSVAAMQLVEQGKLQLDEPIGNVLPELAAPRVLDGFDTSGAPRLRPARRPITLRHLLTHTAGFGYEIWNSDLIRYVEAAHMPSFLSGKAAALHSPLVFDPGERWEYGINIDWVGRAVETASGEPLDLYFAQHIFVPLGMTDTGFVPSADQASRLARVHRRRADGSLEPITFDRPQGEFFSGGGGLLSTGRDYLAFLQMLLHEGRFNDVELLRPETIALIRQNHIGNLELGVMKTAMPELSNDVDLFPSVRCGHGLANVINAQPGPNGRSAGTLTWAGLFNSYYWIDPQKRVTGVILTQILPFADDRAVRLYGEFERGVYDALKAA
jgi:CubicO group peptidase (beta-lactamase class C family)